MHSLISLSPVNPKRENILNIESVQKLEYHCQKLLPAKGHPCPQNKPSNTQNTHQRPIISHSFSSTSRWNLKSVSQTATAFRCSSPDRTIALANLMSQHPLEPHGRVERPKEQPVRDTNIVADRTGSPANRRTLKLTAATKETVDRGEKKNWSRSGWRNSRLSRGSWVSRLKLARAVHCSLPRAPNKYNAPWCTCTCDDAVSEQSITTFVFSFADDALCVAHGQK